LPAAAPLYPLSLHDALPICSDIVSDAVINGDAQHGIAIGVAANRVPGILPLQCETAALDGEAALIIKIKPQGQAPAGKAGEGLADRKSTRLNSSHGSISYAV